MAVGAKDSPQATLIPLGLLQREGLLPGRDYDVRRFDRLVGKHGDHVGGELDAFRCLEAGDAAAALESEGTVLGHSLDITKEAQIAATVADIETRFGRLDILVNNAAILDMSTWDELTYARFNEVMRINLDGALLCAMAAVPAIERAGGGRILNTASIMGLTGTKESIPYSTAKGDGEDFKQSFDNDPSVLLTDVRGYQSYDQRHVVKVNATTITPWGIRLGTATTWQSGLPYSILYRRPSFDTLPPETKNTGITGSRSRLTYPTGVRNDQRNESYWNKDSIKLRIIDAYPIENYNTALNVYLTGGADWTPTYPQSIVDALKDRPDFQKTSGMVVYYYRFNTTKPPFDDARVRKAVAA